MPNLPPLLKQIDARLAALPEEWDAMLLSELDGYIAGLLVCPEPIEPDEWLPPIWGRGNDDDAPRLDDAGERRALIDLIVKHRDAVARDLQGGGDGYGPIFDVDPRHDDVLWELWIGGLKRAMALRPDSWDAIAEGDDQATVAALTVLAALITVADDDDGEFDRAETEALIEAAPDLISECVLTLHAWRHGHGADSLSPAAMAAPSPKVGRNAPCPCGSGRKYKKCCGRT